MASSSRIVGWRRSVLNVARALLLGAIGLGPATPALAQAEQATAALGIGANHGSLSFAPWEQIDTFTGNVLLSFSDVDLPGPAGFNLTIRRHYNGKVGFYPSFDLGFPVVATRTTEDSRVIAFPLHCHARRPLHSDAARHERSHALPNDRPLAVPRVRAGPQDAGRRDLPLRR